MICYAHGRISKIDLLGTVLIFKETITNIITKPNLAQINETYLIFLGKE